MDFDAVPQIGQRNKSTVVWIPRDLAERLRRVAAEMNVTMANFGRAAIAAALDEYDAKHGDGK